MIKNLLITVAFIICLSVNAFSQVTLDNELKPIKPELINNNQFYGLLNCIGYDEQGVPIHMSPDSFFVSIPPDENGVADCKWVAVAYTHGSYDISVERKKFFGRLLSKEDNDTTWIPPPPLNPPTVDVDTLLFKSGLKNAVIISEGFRIQDTAAFRIGAAALFTAIKADAFFSHYYSMLNWLTVFNASPSNVIRHDSTASDCYFTSVPAGQPKASVGVCLTPFDVKFDQGGTHRLLYASNTSKLDSIWVYAALQMSTCTKANSPIKILLVNSPYFGGSGGAYATGSLNNATETMIHEIGHQFGGLADEYGGGSCSGQNKPNVSNATTAAGVAWNVLATTSTFPTPSNTNCSGIGYYCGANYCNACPNVNGTGWVRPACNCKMRNLGVVFCKVCRAGLRNKMYFHLPAGGFLTTYTSTADTVEFPDLPTYTAKFPLCSKISYQWYIGGSAVPNLNNMPEGLYNVSLTVKDTVNYGIYLDNDPQVTITWLYLRDDNPPVPVDNSNFISQTTYTTATTSSSTQITMVFNNTGGTTWTNYTMKPVGSNSFGITTVAVPNTNSGFNATMVFNAIAPSSAGSYTFKWVLCDSNGVAFGDTSTLQTVVVSAPLADNATFVTMTNPTLTMTSGTNQTFTVTMRNEGTSTWNSTYTLTCYLPANGTQWTTVNIPITGTVTPTNTQVISVTIYAPTVSVTTNYNCQWRMKKNGVFFGQTSTNKIIAVSPVPVYNATVTAATLSNLVVGATINTTATVTNTGNTTIPATTYSLRSVSASPSLASINVALASSIAAGASLVVPITFTAPAAGTYNYQLRMYNNVPAAFGSASTNQSVTTVPGGGGTCLPVLNTAYGGGDGMEPVVAGCKIWHTVIGGYNLYKFEYKRPTETNWTVSASSTSVNPRTVYVPYSNTQYHFRITLLYCGGNGTTPINGVNSIITPTITTQ